jgi:predicted RNA-binding Zn ribbon-like protein
MSTVNCSQFPAGTPDHTRCEGIAKIKALNETREAAQRQKITEAVTNATKPLEADLQLLNVTYNSLKGNYSSLQANHTALERTLAESQGKCTRILEALGIPAAVATCANNSETILSLAKEALQTLKDNFRNLGLCQGFGPDISSTLPICQKIAIAP